MANTKHQAIRAAIAALLRAGPALAGGRIVENRTYPLAQGLDSQVHVNYSASNPERMAVAGAPITWTTTVDIVIKTRRTVSSSAEDLADSIWADVYARLMADQSLGGRVAYLDPGAMSAQDDQLDADVCELTWSLTYTHDTANNAIT